ncbi:MAG: hypothetical protein AAF416_14355 [Pseudomonadota bacterium]
MQSHAYLPLRGGLDISVPAMLIKDGFAISAQNYEADVGGYRRFIGYEAFDGRPAPSSATYYVMDFTAAEGAPPSAGDTITGATSGATGILLAAPVFDDGSATDGYYVYKLGAGTFQAGEDVEVSSSKVSEAVGAGLLQAAPTPALDNTYQKLAADDLRQAITAVPGEGPVRGVAAYNGDVYAWRDNVGQTEGVMYRATSSGWTAVSGNVNRIAFQAASAAFVAGGTLTGGTSGATATIVRVMVTTGAPGNGTQTGFLYLSGISGTFEDAETLTGSAGGSATASGAVSQLGFPPGGHYETTETNFFGAASSRRLYGANGVGPAFEWDGTNLVFLETGLDSANERPAHIAEFRKHLFLGYRAGSVIFSGIGNPHSWSTTDGAGEIGVGSPISGLVASSATLVIGSDNRVDYLTGTSASDFVNNPLSPDSGMREHTLHQIDQPVYLDDGAIRGLSATEALGGWRMGSMSRRVEALFDTLRSEGVTPVCSMRVRQRDLYRVFFSDGSAISMYLGRKDPEIMTLDFPVQASCAYSSYTEGEDRLFIGAEDGFVYEFDKDRTFNGNTMICWVRLGWFHGGRPHDNKRFVAVQVEAEAPGSSTIGIASEVDYGNPDAIPGIQNVTSISGGGFWDESRWDTIYYDLATVAEIDSTIDQLGRNITFAIYHEGNGDRVHVLKVLTIWHAPRGRRRR